MNKKELLRSLKFLLFSVSAGIIQLGGFALLNELLHLDYWVSYLIALVASVLWNFTFTMSQRIEVTIIALLFTKRNISYGVSKF